MDDMTLCQKLDLLEPLMGFVAHKLNNSLAIINGYTEMLKVECKDSSSCLEKIAKINQSSQNMSDFMLELLLLSDRCPLNIHKKSLSDLEKRLKTSIGEYFKNRFEYSAQLNDDKLYVNIDIEQFDIAVMSMLKAFDQISNQQCDVALNIFSEKGLRLSLEVGNLSHFPDDNDDLFDAFTKESADLKPDALALLLFYSIVKKHKWNLDAKYENKLLALDIIVN